MYGPFMLIGSELIKLNRYIRMQRWRWVCCLLHPKYVPFLLGSSLLLRSHDSMKIIIAQAERDESIHSLLKKLAEVYCFMTQDGSFGKIESMRGIVGKIVQQTLECARFIRDYSETKGFCESPSYRASHMNFILLS